LILQTGDSGLGFHPANGIDVGSNVKTGDPLAFITVMGGSLLVKATCDGDITYMCVEDIVKGGDELFKILETVTPAQTASLPGSSDTNI
jgi:hypothetical protein